jgi:hypothetical protein
VEFDDSKWPLLLITVPRIFVPESVDALCRGFDERYFPNNRPYCIVLDTRPVWKIPDAAARQVLFKWMNSAHVQSHSSRLCVGAALIVASHIARLGITAVAWAWKQPVPTAAVANMREAVAWSCNKLERAKIDLGPRLREFLVSVERS